MSVPCQRWSFGYTSYRTDRATFDPGRHDVQLIDEGTAKRFVETHHYSRSYPAARVRVGLFRKDPFARARLVGCAVFSVPMNQHAITAHAGLPPDQGVELGRFVLADEVERHGETAFLSRAVGLLRTALPQVRAVLSYSDPVPRQIGDRLIKPGHIGIIYQAGNFLYRGRGRARTLLVARRTGQVVSERTLSKLRSGDRGREYALRQLRDLGAPPPAANETVEAWLARVLASDVFVRFRHPGNHCYVLACGAPAARRAIWRALPPGLPYPKQAEAAFVL